MDDKIIYDLTIKDLLNTILIDSSWTNSLNNTQCFEELRRLEEKLQKRWVDSKCTDFSIYSSPTYYSNLILCNIFYSSKIIDKCLEYFKTHFSATYAKMAWCEDYPGFGLTTAKLIGNNIENVSIFNDNKEQICMMERLFKKLNLKMPIILDTHKNSQYDIVCSFEVAEHFKEPINYLDKIVDMVKPNGFLCYSATYQLHNVKRGFYYTGHHGEYEIHDSIETDRNAIDVLLDRHLMNRGLEICHMTDDRRPVIYKKIK